MKPIYTFAAFTVLSLVAAPSAQAVFVNPRGTGQVLIYPYFNAQAGNTTLITLRNDSHEGKAVRVRWAGSHRGDSELSFNLYISREDVWVGAIFSMPSATGTIAGLITDDHSCTYPRIRNSTTLPQLPDGRRYIPLVASADGTDGESVREGYVEVIEMATFKIDSPTYYSSFITLPENSDCSPLLSQWSANYWGTDPKRDLLNPTGGLSGSEAIVNPAAGTIFSIPAVALEDFRADPLDKPRGTLNSLVIHTKPEDARPALLDAITDPAAQIVSANVIADGRTLTATYPVSQAIDAVSAVLMATSVSNDFEEASSAGATTSLVLTYPTRRFYANPALVGAQPLAPFKELIPNPIQALAHRTVDFLASNRDQTMTSTQGADDLDPQLVTLETGTAVVTLGLRAVADPLLGSAVAGYFQDLEGFDAGAIRLLFARNPNVRTRPSREGWEFVGQPVIGTRLINFINGQLPGGVLANYSNALPMTSALHCRQEAVDNCEQ